MALIVDFPYVILGKQATPVDWPVVKAFDETLMQPVHLWGYKPTYPVLTNETWEPEFIDRLSTLGVAPVPHKIEQAPISVRINRTSLLF